MGGKVKSGTGLAERWLAYLFWSFWVTLAFVAVYPASNWFTAQRAEVYRLYFDWELDIPLLPHFIWPYLSMYLLFLVPPFFLDSRRLALLGRRLIIATAIAGLLFLLLPAQLGYERVLPESSLYRIIYAAMFSVDLPHNMAPSLHVLFSALILWELTSSPASSHLKGIWGLWLVLISASTLLVHQHHLVDVFSALLLVWLIRITTRQGTCHDQTPD